MTVDARRQEMLEALAEVPVIDVHTHVVGGGLGASGLHDIMLYHMAVSDLYAAGCPSGSRLTPYPDRPDRDETHARIREALPFLRHVRNTSSSWGVRLILSDLYGCDEAIGEDNWQTLDEQLRERADDRAWHREILRRVNIRRVGTEIARREKGEDDDILQYALEWAFFTRFQWGEFDTALYELERCWGRTPESPMPIGIGIGSRPPTDRTIRTLDDVDEAMDWYVDHIPADRIRSVATHISTDIDLRDVTHDEMNHALAQRGHAGPAECSIYAAYVNEAFLSRLERRYADRLVFQFSLGAEPLPHETASRLSQRTIAQLAEIIGRHPKLRFQCFLSSAHANQSLCTLCRELPNLSLAAYWWHNFFPAVIRRVMEERLDMLPANRQIGFFSDAYCVEWTYAKAKMVRRLLAQVLAEKIALGEYTNDLAVSVARQILYESPQSLLGMTPANP
jgi:hypothetical protein